MKQWLNDLAPTKTARLLIWIEFSVILGMSIVIGNANGIINGILIFAGGILFIAVIVFPSALAIRRQRESQDQEIKDRRR